MREREREREKLEKAITRTIRERCNAKLLCLLSGAFPAGRIRDQEESKLTIHGECHSLANGGRHVVAGDAQIRPHLSPLDTMELQHRTVVRLVLLETAATCAPRKPLSLHVFLENPLLSSYPIFSTDRFFFTIPPRFFSTVLIRTVGRERLADGFDDVSKDNFFDIFEKVLQCVAMDSIFLFWIYI